MACLLLQRCVKRGDGRLCTDADEDVGLFSVRA